jgi:hypothetical protein
MQQRAHPEVLVAPGDMPLFGNGALMTILFLHGWHSMPGGVKPSYRTLRDHEAINPARDYFDPTEPALARSEPPFLRRRLLPGQGFRVFCGLCEPTKVVAASGR